HEPIAPYDHIGAQLAAPTPRDRPSRARPGSRCSADAAARVLLRRPAARQAGAAQVAQVLPFRLFPPHFKPKSKKNLRKYAQPKPRRGTHGPFGSREDPSWLADGHGPGPTRVTA